MKTIRVIGLTGQTGAGKSTVSTFAAAHGAGIIDADIVAREITQPGSPCLEQLCAAFGSDIVDENGVLIRSLLAQRAFKDREQTQRLNAITHPAILAKTKTYIEALRHKHKNIILFDAPQLFESGGEVLCDAVIAVTAPQAVRLERIMRRDHLSREDALRRMHAQHDAAYYTERADYVIDGAATLEDVHAAAWKILREIAGERWTKQQGRLRDEQ